MDVVLFNSEEEGRITLTDDTSDGRYVVRIASSRRYPDGDYLPDDSLGESPFEMAVGAYVFDWATQAIRSDAGINAALLYLRQSPRYADFESGDLSEAREEKEKLMTAAKNLFVGEKPMDQMSCDELRMAIERWNERLCEFVPDSDEARILGLRIEMAKTMIRHHS
jgi:hypothetical protein